MKREKILEERKYAKTPMSSTPYLKDHTLTPMSSTPYLKDHTLFMGGDKVRDKIFGTVFRVKARFAINFVDYITLEKIDSENEERTYKYFDIIDKLTLVCHPKKSYES